MCLSIAIERPLDVLAKGTHAGHEWQVIHNGNGFRCGYVKVPAGHPWHGKDYRDIDAEVHGGLTFSEPDVPCGAGGPDDGHWVGFDCAHGHDLPDPALPVRHPGMGDRVLEYMARMGAAVRSQEYAEAECRSLCEQAASAVGGVV